MGVMSDDLKERLKDRAREIGFDAVGIAPASLPELTTGRLEAFIAFGRHGDMEWMADKADRRRSPQALWPGARSAIVVGTNYGPGFDPMARLEERRTGVISVYALGRDYHDVMKGKLKELAGCVAREAAAEVKVFVDTAPVMEKPIAERAGLGWQGKHTNLVSRDFGSWLFLGVILTSAELKPDGAEADRCGSCRACLDVCPTNAFPKPYQLDARRCISYLTIEHRGHIPREFRSAIGNRVYGCDDCLAVCPWNKFARLGREAKLAAREELVAPSLEGLAALDDAGFRDLFRGSPIKRTGRDRFVRNVLIAIGNSAEPDLIPAARSLLDDGSPLVRAMAVWALSRLEGPESFAALKEQCLPGETDPAVRQEWLEAAA